ncbi:MAG: hypothetical protein ABL958_00515 [Bdellovibrionia bacterium]
MQPGSYVPGGNDNLNTESPLVKISSVPFTPQSTAFSLRICVAGIETMVGSATYAAPQVVDIQPLGTVLPGAGLPFGNQEYVILIASNRCAGLPSVFRLINDNGTFDGSGSRALVNFTMTPVPSPAPDEIKLNFSPLMAGLAAVTSNIELATLFGSTTGTYTQ